MLIRSQNREVLINLNSVKGIEIAEGPIKTIITSYITGCSYLLGEYSDKEKAFKVLDLIQEVYTWCIAINTVLTGLTANDVLSIDISDNKEELTAIAETIKRANICQMPQDSEVE